MYRSFCYLYVHKYDIKKCCNKFMNVQRKVEFLIYLQKMKQNMYSYINKMFKVSIYK